MKAEFDVWMYSASGARLFQEGEDIPAGYVDSPAKVTEDQPKRRGRPPKNAGIGE